MADSIDGELQRELEIQAAIEEATRNLMEENQALEAQLEGYRAVEAKKYFPSYKDFDDIFVVDRTDNNIGIEDRILTGTLNERYAGKSILIGNQSFIVRQMQEPDNWVWQFSNGADVESVAGYFSFEDAYESMRKFAIENLGFEINPQDLITELQEQNADLERRLAERVEAAKYVPSFKEFSYREIASSGFEYYELSKDDLFAAITHSKNGAYEWHAETTYEGEKFIEDGVANTPLEAYQEIRESIWINSEYEQNPHDIIEEQYAVISRLEEKFSINESYSFDDALNDLRDYKQEIEELTDILNERNAEIEHLKAELAALQHDGDGPITPSLTQIPNRDEFEYVYNPTLQDGRWTKEYEDGTKLTVFGGEAGGYVWHTEIPTVTGEFKLSGSADKPEIAFSDMATALIDAGEFNAPENIEESIRPGREELAARCMYLESELNNANKVIDSLNERISAQTITPELTASKVPATTLNTDISKAAMASRNAMPGHSISRNNLSK